MGECKNTDTQTTQNAHYTHSSSALHSTFRSACDSVKQDGFFSLRLNTLGAADFVPPTKWQLQILEFSLEQSGGRLENK